MSVTQGSKHSAQNTNNSLKKTPIKSNQNTKMEDKSTKKEMNKNLGSEVKLQDIFELISCMSKKMEKLDIIQENMENIQTELKEVRKSIEYAHKKAPEESDENTTAMIHKLLEEKLGFEDAAMKIKIDRSHRLGKKKWGETKVRPIVAKFNYHQEKVFQSCGMQRS